MDAITLAMAKAYSDSKGGYVEERLVEVCNETDFQINDQGWGGAYYGTLSGISISKSWCKNNARFIIVWDGVRYEYNAFEYDDGTVVVGNQNPFAYGTMDGNIPFSFELSGQSVSVWAKEPGEYTFTVTAIEEIVHTIDPKFLPGNGEVVVVNLADCEIVPTSEMPAPNMNLAILSMFANGGGICSVPDDSNFWDIVSADKTVRFVIDASSLATGLSIEAEAKSRVKYHDRLEAIETSFMVEYGDWYIVTVMFTNEGMDTRITVHVNRLAIS